MFFTELQSWRWSHLQERWREFIMYSERINFIRFINFSMEKRVHVHSHTYIFILHISFVAEI